VRIYTVTTAHRRLYEIDVIERVDMIFIGNCRLGKDDILHAICLDNHLGGLAPLLLVAFEQSLKVAKSDNTVVVFYRRMRRVIDNMGMDVGKESTYSSIYLMIPWKYRTDPSAPAHEVY